MNQPEALRLAEKLGDYGGCTLAQMDAAAAELRRLHAENEALRAERDRNLNTINMDNTIINKYCALNAELVEALKHTRAVLLHDKWADDTRLVIDVALAKVKGKA